MIEETIVQDNTDYLRINGGIVNRNDDAYHLALKRRREKSRMDLLEDRVKELETTIELLLKRLENESINNINH